MASIHAKNQIDSSKLSHHENADKDNDDDADKKPSVIW
jgi:hypothetical protein